MTDWKIAMLLAIPLMRGLPMWRTWTAMFGAAIAALFMPFAAGYLALDLLAGALVLRRPAGGEQKAIGLLFAGMAIADIGYICAGEGTPHAYAAMLSFFGWGQFSILVAWGLHDRWRHYFRRGGVDGGVPVASSRGV